MVTALYTSSYSVKAQTNTIAQAGLTHDELIRKQEMEYAFKGYKGKLPDPLKTEPNMPNHNTKVNRCEPIVNKGASALFGEVLKIEASDESGRPIPLASQIPAYRTSSQGYGETMTTV